jgi:carbonic anhydrase
MRKFFAIILVLSFALPVLANAPGPVTGRDQALNELRSGNSRFAAGHPNAWNITAEKREILSKGQYPKACIITCSDSRVSPEYLFDQSMGDIFVVRLAGNVITPEAVGSVEYAVEHLHVPVVVVLGHSGCGAVNAALSEGAVEGSIGNLLSYIKPAINAAKQKGFSGDELAGAVVSENARHGTEDLLNNSRLIDDAVKTGKVSVVSGTYDLKSGKVAWQNLIAAIPEAPVAAAPAAAPAADKTVKVASTDKPAAKSETVAVKSKSTTGKKAETTAAPKATKIATTDKPAVTEPAKPVAVVEKPVEAAPVAAAPVVTAEKAPEVAVEKAPEAAAPPAAVEPAKVAEAAPAPVAEKPAEPVLEKIASTEVAPAAAPAVEAKPEAKVAEKPAPKKREVSAFAKRH